MLPTSHLAPIYGRLSTAAPQQSGDAALLADAFSEFIAASAKLERSYRDLQVEVGQLGSELAARNAELETSLRRNEQTRLALAEVVDTMPCGVLVLGSRARVQRVNPEARRILALGAGVGTAPEMVPARQSAEFASQEAMAGCQPESLDAILGATGVDLCRFCALEGEHEFSFLPPPGADGRSARRWIAVRTRRLAGDASDVETILILTDVSAHRQAEQDREAGRRALAQAEVAATLAHEIRNPLASLELFTGLLEEEPARSADWIAHMRAGLRSLSATVNNMLSFHGAGFLPLRSLVLARAVESAVDFVRPLAQQAGVGLSLWCADRTSRVMANEAALGQIVLNLVANAVRHTQAGGSIAVALTHADRDHLLLSVTDTGHGIQPEHLDKIFEPGWSAAGASTGLGLAVCQRIAAQHGSLLTVSSVVGRGTVFEMELAIV